ncbi:helix-turn-helix transcriptional regulator [Geobacter argillaceus]|uniref:DNA-binding transcriptional repressor CapW winged helix-turn-helix domain-containing protein n=1 Tax=Geobacter argillaceus TaxID=345631 RepID=A0A562W8K2_9BACT|nr:hypothetical protein [Geobacter argillaceus]TWJ26532.1 hypothetical protein JN12_01244 [Geobacter argillaceus]
MGEQLYFERFIWFDGQVRKGKYPNATSLAERFEVDKKTAQRSIEHFRDRICAPLEYDQTRKGYHYYEDFSFPVARLSENELLALLISRKLLSDASPRQLGDDLNHVVTKLGSMIAAGMPGAISPDQAFSFRWNGFSPSDSLHFSIVSRVQRHIDHLGKEVHKLSLVHEKSGIWRFKADEIDQDLSRLPNICCNQVNVNDDIKI